MASDDLIIIGSGMGGYTLLREFRKLDANRPITLICQDSGDFYSKPMLSNALAQGKTAATLVTQSAQAMSEAQGFTLVANTHVDSIDPATKTVRAGERAWSYGQLVIATGASPIRPPMQGDAASSPLAVNHLDDYRVFRDQLDAAQHITIIGPGLIGCEFANDLLSQDKHIDIIGPDQWPISTLLPKPVGEFLQQKLQALGVTFHLQTTVAAVDRNNGSYALTLDNGTSLRSDLVLSAIGLRPQIDLAQQTGLNTQRGIVCDLELRTSDEHIFALGDCAEVNGLNLPFIMPIMHCARALAKTLAGQPTAVAYPAMPVAIKTPACPLVAAPPVDRSIEATVEHTEDGVKALYYRDENLVGFVLAGDAVSEKQALTRSLPAMF